MSVPWVKGIKYLGVILLSRTFKCSLANHI